MQGRFTESLTKELKKLSLKSSKRVKGREENSKNDFLISRKSNELPLKAKRTWNDIYERGDDSNTSDLDKHDIYSSKKELKAIEDFEDVDDVPEKSNKALNSLNAKRQLLKSSFIKSNKYHINKEILIGSVSKSAYIIKNKESTSFGIKSRSGRNTNLMNL